MRVQLIYFLNEEKSHRPNPHLTELNFSKWKKLLQKCLTTRQYRFVVHENKLAYFQFSEQHMQVKLGKQMFRMNDVKLRIQKP